MSGCNTKLQRVRQILGRLEDCETGMELDLGAADAGLEVAVAPNIDPEVEMIERDVARSSITKLQGVIGKISGGAKFTHEFKGEEGPGFVKPKVVDYLEACSMGVRNVFSIDLDTVSFDPSNTAETFTVNSKLYATSGGASGSIATLSVVGTGFGSNADGTYTIVQGVDFTTTGSGVGATIDVTVASNANVSAVVNVGGTGFNANEGILISQIDGSSFVGGALNIDTVGAGGLSDMGARIVIPVDLGKRRDVVYYETLKADGVTAPSLADATEYEVVSEDGSVLGTFITGSVESAVVGSAVYPISRNQKSMTIRVEEEGYQRTIYGAMGNFSIMAENSGLGKFEFDFQGIVPDGQIYTVNGTPAMDLPEGSVLLVGSGGDVKFVVRKALTVAGGALTDAEIWIEVLEGDVSTVVDGDILFLQDGSATGTTTTLALSLANTNDNYRAGFGDHVMTEDVVYSSLVPPTLRDANLLFGGYKPAFSEVSVESGNEVALRQSGNSADRGFINAVVNARSPKGSFDPEFMSEADYDYFGKWFSGEPVALEYQLSNDEINNRMYFYAKKAQTTGGSNSERDGVTTLGAEASFVGSTKDQDDEYRIVFY